MSVRWHGHPRVPAALVNTLRLALISVSVLEGSPGQEKLRASRSQAPHAPHAPQLARLLLCRATNDLILLSSPAIDLLKSRLGHSLFG